MAAYCELQPLMNEDSARRHASHDAAGKGVDSEGQLQPGNGNSPRGPDACNCRRLQLHGILKRRYFGHKKRCADQNRARIEANQWL